MSEITFGRRGRMRGATALLAAGVLSLGMAACGSDSSGDSGSSGSSSSGDSKQEQARLDFTKCLRENGVDVSDSDLSGGPGQIPEGVDQQQLQDAQEKCQKYLQDAVGDISDEDRTKLQDSIQEFTKCLRAEGVDVEDPDPSSGGGPGGGGLTQLDQSDPRVKAALEKCQDKLPTMPGGSGN